MIDTVILIFVLVACLAIGFFIGGFAILMLLTKDEDDLYEQSGRVEKED